MAKRTDRKRAAWHPLQSPCNPRPGLVPGPAGPEGLCSRTQEWRGQSFKNRREGDSHSSRRCPLAALRGCPHSFGCSRRWASLPPPGSCCRPRAALRFRGAEGRGPGAGEPAGLTCLKQKGMVRTLTPTMLFTTFMISPQLEAAAAVMARGLGPGGPGARRRDHGGREALRGTGGCLEEAALREGGGDSQPLDPPRPRGRLMASSPAHSRWPPLRPRARTRKSRQRQLGTPQPDSAAAPGRTLPPAAGSPARK